MRYSFKEILENAERVRWRVEDIVGGDKRLDFKRPFLPESLARVDSMDFLTSQEKLLFNQIRGYGYLYTFGMVEEFICLLCSTTSVQEHTDRIKFFLIGCRFDRPPFDLLVEKQILREIKQCDS